MDISKLKKGDTVLVKCTVESVFVNSGMVLVTTRDCNDGFDAYEDEIIKCDERKGWSRDRKRLEKDTRAGQE